MEDLQTRLKRIKEENPEAWEAYEKMCAEFWRVMWPFLVSEGVISRRYYSKKKIGGDVENAEIHTDTKDH